MGQIETEVRKEIKRKNIQKIILGTLATVGILSVAVIAPNVLQILKTFGIINKRKTNPKYSVNRAFYNLLEKGMIKVVNKNGKKFVEITPNGKNRLGLAQMYKFKLKKPKRWDKKWRVIIFDIKINRNKLRDKLRWTLKQIGFVMLQNSVWVYPYDCEDFVILLKVDFKIGKDVLYMVVDKIENDQPLKSHFKLK